ncbi:MAG: hypothetical protein H6878_06600 [Rhodobiaceae bacterium]|nr:hypothetical protein [Rhodobiaceae bacterium]MCC0042444.1 hypothetical protein [Rhodobiaceae bacterium]
MASKDEPEENYWPGYVDALTTMTMVLTFVMMILALAVFILSQNVSKILLEAILQEANIEVPDPGTPEAIKEKLKELLANANQDRSTPSLTTGHPESVEAPQTEIRAEKIDTPDDGAEKVKATRTPSVLTVTYEETETRLNDNTKLEVAAFTSESDAVRNAKRIVIHAYAHADNGGLSQARRAAYYRGMLLRAELIANGIEPDRLHVEVIETEDADKGQTAEVFAQ